MPKESTIGEEKWASVKKYKITKMLNDLSKISGHGTEKSFLKNIKISQENNANKLIDHLF